MNTRTCLLTALLIAAPMLHVSPATAAQQCTIAGTPGDDRLVGTPARDVICGRGGDDVLIGRGGNDLLIGGRGEDVLRGGAGADLLRGQDDRDTMHGGGGHDTLAGGRAEDHLVGGAGRDRLLGGTGMDRLHGGAGRDRLEGGFQNDILVGGAGPDLLSGGGGADIADYSSSLRGVHANGDGLRNDGAAGERDLILRDVENFWGGRGDDVLIVHAVDRPNRYSRMAFGGRGDDILIGTDERDWLRGDKGNDRIVGLGEFDEVGGGDGYDIVSGGPDKDYVSGEVCDRDWYSSNLYCDSFDTTAPEVTAVTAQPESVAPGETVTITVAATDSSGAWNAGYRILRDGERVSLCDAAITRTEPVWADGAWTEGTWVGDCVVPADAVPGYYTVVPFADDVMGNRTDDDAVPTATFLVTADY